jgi:hypothetical protein
MDYVLEKYREHIVPIVYECLEQLYTKLRENNDIITFHRWKDLVEHAMYKDMSIANSFEIFMKNVNRMPNYEDYRTIIMNMFVRYEKNPIGRNQG